MSSANFLEIILGSVDQVKDAHFNRPFDTPTMMLLATQGAVQCADFLSL
jgi:hypothetical protein